MIPSTEPALAGRSAPVQLQEETVHALLRGVFAYVHGFNGVSNPRF